MKKIYMKPSAKMETMETVMMICGSQDITSNDGDITYGGVDDDGDKDPASRQQRNMWDEE